MRSTNTALSLIAVQGIALAALTATPALASGGGDDEVRVGGSCSSRAGWEMRARWDDDHRIEVGGQVDSGRAGQAWTWKIKHNGSVSSSGHATTDSDGSFKVERALVDLAGVDHCVFRAVRVRTGEVCRGTIDW